MYNFQDVFKYSKELSVLYVEDDKPLQKETNEVLEDFFIKVDLASNGIEGLDSYNNYQKQNDKFYDIIITDLRMPLKDGFEMINEITQINPKQIIIVVSAHNEPERLIQLIQNGIDNFIMKPIKYKQLVSVLHKTSKNIHNQKEISNILIEKTKTAQMSEMINQMAQQWLQPINVLKLQTDLLEMESFENKRLPENVSEYVKDFVSTNNEQIDYLTSSIKEFRRFFSVTSEKDITTYKNIIKSVEILLKKSLVNNNIKFFNEINDNSQLSIITSDVKFIIIKIINNSINNFIKNNVENRIIKVSTENKDNQYILNITDNAKGKSEDIKSEIFKDTLYPENAKDENRTSLSIPSIILNKSNGSLKISSLETGVKFSISLKSSDFS